jgi:hypothetical protein
MENLEREFVPYELALRMKNLGFDNVPCLAVWYNVPELDDYEFFDFSNHFSYQHYETHYYANKGFKDAFLAPTWNQAFRWFDYSTEYSGFIVPSPEEGLFTWWVQNYIEPQLSHETRESYLTREEAELACLKKLIEIVEQSKSE